MEEATCTGISRLVAAGATLQDVESYVEARTTGLTEEERSAAWLRDWLALSHPAPPPAPGLEPLE